VTSPCGTEWEIVEMHNFFWPLLNFFHHWRNWRLTVWALDHNNLRVKLSLWARPLEEIALVQLPWHFMLMKQCWIFIGPDLLCAHVFNLMFIPMNMLLWVIFFKPNWDISFKIYFTKTLCRDISSHRYNDKYVEM
jgi:hypothetical protein